MCEAYRAPKSREIWAGEHLNPNLGFRGLGFIRLDAGVSVGWGSSGTHDNYGFQDH